MFKLQNLRLKGWFICANTNLPPMRCSVTSRFGVTFEIEILPMYFVFNVKSLLLHRVNSYFTDLMCIPRIIFITSGLNSTCLFLMEVWSDRGSTCKFRNARSAFRNLHVDPLSFHTSMRNKQVEFNPYIYTLTTLSKLYRFGYEISVF